MEELYDIEFTANEMATISAAVGMLTISPMYTPSVLDPICNSIYLKIINAKSGMMFEDINEATSYIKNQVAERGTLNPA